MGGFGDRLFLVFERLLDSAVEAALFDSGLPLLISLLMVETCLSFGLVGEIMVGRDLWKIVGV